MKTLDNVVLHGRPPKGKSQGPALKFTKAEDEFNVTAGECDLTVADLFRNGFYWHARVAPREKRSEEHARIANKGLDQIERTEDQGVIELEDNRYDILRQYATVYLQDLFLVHMPYVLDQLDGLVKERESGLLREAPRPGQAGGLQPRES